MNHKVLCVHKCFPDQPVHPDLIDAANKIQVGSIYTVVDEVDDCYELGEFPHPCQILWDKRAFAPLTGIDELELVNEKMETA